MFIGWNVPERLTVVNLYFNIYEIIFFKTNVSFKMDECTMYWFYKTNNCIGVLTNINKTSMIYRHDLIKKLDALRDSNSELAQMVLDQVWNTWLSLYFLYDVDIEFHWVKYIVFSYKIYDNAMIAAGLNEDPRPMISRLNKLLTQALDKHWSSRCISPRWTQFYYHWSCARLCLTTSRPQLKIKLSI